MTQQKWLELKNNDTDGEETTEPTGRDTGHKEEG